MLISNRLFTGAVVVVQLLALHAIAAEEEPFDVTKHPRLVEDLKVLGLSEKATWTAEDPKRSSTYPNRIIRNLKGGDAFELRIDAASFEVLHFQRIGKPLDDENPTHLDADVLRGIAVESIAQLAPNANLGPMKAAITKHGTGKSSDWDLIANFAAQHYLDSLPYRARFLDLSLSAYTGRVISYTNSVPVAPKSLDHKMTASEAADTAKSWLENNVSPQEFKNVAAPTLEIVVTKENKKKAATMDISSQLAWVVRFDAPHGMDHFVTYCLLIDAVTGKVLESDWPD